MDVDVDVEMDVDVDETPDFSSFCRSISLVCPASSGKVNGVRDFPFVFAFLSSSSRLSFSLFFFDYLPTFLIVKNFVGQDKSHALPYT